MTITRVSFARRPFLPRKFARSVMLKRVRNAGRERRRRWLRNVSDDRCVAGMTRGIVSADAGSGMAQTREEIDGNRPRGDGGMTMRRTLSALVVPAMPGRRDATRKVHPGAADTALPPLRKVRRGGRRAADDRDVLRDQEARAPPMRRASGVLVVLPPSGIAHILLTMRGSFHGGTDKNIVPAGAAVQQSILLLMWIIPRGINDALATMTVRADIGADTDPARALLIRRLVPRHCPMV